MEILDGKSMPLSRILAYLRKDSTRNLFAIYDLVSEPAKTTISLAVDVGEAIIGYLLRYHGLSYPTAIVRGLRPAVTELLDELTGEKMVLFLDPDAMSIASLKLNPTAVIAEDLMTVTRGEARLSTENNARRLNSGDAEGILDLYPGVTRTRENSEGYERWVEEHVVYGIFDNGVLASVAGTWAEVEDGWIVGGVYTSPTYRGRGFATLTSSAVTEEALGKAQQSTLFVVSSNKIAVHVYEKLGYRKAGKRLWFDLGTGVKPLMAES